MWNSITHKLFPFILCSCIAAGLSCTDVLGQGSSFEAESSYYISIHGALFLQSNFPDLFEGYRASGAAPANSYYPREFGYAKGGIGFGTSFGYMMNGETFRLSGEVELSMITHPNAEEKLDATTWSNYQATTVRNLFTQSERRDIAALVNLHFGLYPFENNNLGFYLTAGFGIGVHSFHSEATAYAERIGYNVKTATKYESKDLGDYNGSGNFSRSSFLYLVGLGSELFITQSISLKLDYKYIGSSYSRENVLISSGAVNTYQNKVSYEYTFASKLSLAVLYYFTASDE